jgi:photosystem II stability/assembly factor-like uncharacterized protein
MDLRTHLDRPQLFKQGRFWLPLLLISLFSSAGARAQSWRAVGPGGGDVRALAIDPNHMQQVYLGTTDGHIFGSHDGGEHWSLLGLAGPKANAVVTAIIVDPRDSTKLYVSTWTRERDGEGGGVYLSFDAGKSWRETGLAGHAVRALAQAPSNPDNLIAGALDGVFRFRIEDERWERISPAGDPELHNFDSLSIDPLNADIVYAGTFHLPWKTMDGGQHWLPVHRGMKDDSDVLSLAVDPTDSQRVFASTCSGIYHSEDAGALWRPAQGIPDSSRRTTVIRIDPSNPANLYAGTTEGLWKSTDGGMNWRRGSPREWVVNSLVTAPGRILVGTEEQGVLVSDDGGDHFHDANSGFIHRRVVSLATDHGNPERVAAIFAGVQEPVAASEDAGGTWSPLGHGLKAADVSKLFSAPDGLLAALNSGGFARLDTHVGIWERAGTVVENTEARPLSGPVQLTGKRKPFTARVNDFSFSSGAWFAATDEGLFVSQDAGDNWSVIPLGPVALPVNSVRAENGGEKLRIVAGLAMVFSDDAGATWHWHDLPLESGGALSLEFLDDSAALAVARNGLYISRDAGISWLEAGAGLPRGALTGILIRPDIWLASVEVGGLYLSRDRGASWLRTEAHGYAKLDLELSPFHAFVSDEATGLVFAGSTREGLYIVDLSPAARISGGGGSRK